MATAQSADSTESAPAAGSATQSPLLSDLLKAHGAHTDKATMHQYGALYDLWFAKYRDIPIGLLELGVSCFGGGDLLAFARYFRQGRIYGIDLYPEGCLPEVLADPRISVLRGDAYALATRRLLGATALDIILDDCDHAPERQLTAFAIYYGLLRPGGLYVIEDVASAEAGRWLTASLESLVGHERVQLVDLTASGRFDDRVIRIEKPDRC